MGGLPNEVSPIRTYPKQTDRKSANTDWAHHVGSSSDLITVVVMTLFHPTALLALSWLSEPVLVWYLLLLMMLYPRFVWILSIWTGPLLTTLLRSSIYWWISWYWCCRRGLSFCRSSFLQLFNKLLRLFITASQKINIVSKSQVAKRGRPPMDTDDSEVSTSCALYFQEMY